LEPLPSKGPDRALDSEEPVQIISHGHAVELTVLYDDWVPPTMQE